MASYREAIEWIARNDEDGETDVEVMSGLISVLLVADLWRKEPEDVAKAVVRERLREHAA